MKEKQYKESVIERNQRIGTAEKIAYFKVKQQLPYECKVQYALLLFLRSIGIDPPAISASSLEDKSIQKIHKMLGVETVKPLKSKVEILKEYGYPILSKEIAGKMGHLQNPTENNATVRHAIITGETGAYGGNRTNTRMKMSQKWLDRFGGADPEGAALGYKAAPFKVSDRCCYFLKEKPCDDWAKAHNSVPYLGLMASEGGRREKSLMMNGCNYFGKSTIRSAPFAIFSRQDLLQLALDLNVPVPEIYGEIVRDEDGTLRTTVLTDCEKRIRRNGISGCMTRAGAKFWITSALDGRMKYEQAGNG